MDSALAFAEAALARGDYNQCITSLEILVEKYSLNSKEGAKIRMLLITALLGKGDDEKAISICKDLTRCKANEVRQTSKNLLSVLQSPSLARPANWSIQLPNLDLTPQIGGNSFQSISKQKKLNAPPSPPTGPTKGPSIGFSIFVLFILLTLTIFLSGCVKITTKIAIPGPDRINLEWEIESNAGKLLPWQSKFENSFEKSPTQIEIISISGGKQKVKAPISTSKEANLILQQTFSKAAKSAGLEISSPILSLKERNWLLGVQQDLKLVVDLTNLPEIPGLRLLVRVDQIKNENTKGSPIPTTQNGDQVNWQMQQGKVNILELHQWNWNKLGIGVLIIFLILLINLTLQRIRLQMGFGFPELPP